MANPTIHKVLDPILKHHRQHRFKRRLSILFTSWGLLGLIAAWLAPLWNFSGDWLWKGFLPCSFLDFRRLAAPQAPDHLSKRFWLGALRRSTPPCSQRSSRHWIRSPTLKPASITICRSRSFAKPSPATQRAVGSPVPSQTLFFRHDTLLQFTGGFLGRLLACLTG